MSKPKKSDRQESDSPNPITRAIVWMLLVVGWFFVVAALVSFSPNDPPSHAAAPLNSPPANWCGAVGALIAYKAYVMLGPGVWLMVVGCGVALAMAALRRPIDQPVLRLAGLMVMGIAVSGFVQLFAPSSGAFPEGSGGLLAIYGVGKLTSMVHALGASLTLALCFGVGALLAADRIVLALPRLCGEGWDRMMESGWPQAVFGALVVAMRNVLMAPLAIVGVGRRRSDDAPAPASRKPIPVRHASAKPNKKGRKKAEAIDEDAGGLGATEAFDPEEEVDVDTEEGDEPAKANKPKAKKPKARKDLEEEPETKPVAEPVETEVKDVKLDPETLREKIKGLPISFAAKPTTKAPPPPPKQDLSGYKFPDMSMLEEPDDNFSDGMANVVREQAERLEQALHQYKIDAEVVAIDAGPVITLYEVQLAPGTKVSQLNALSSDLARALKAQNIRIVANTAGKSTVGIEVPNNEKERVRLKELMTIGHQEASKMALPMYLGKDASGNPLIADLAKMPHMLIAGTTGSGKSVCMNSIIMSFLYARRPDELKLVLVDPKMVEMAQFRDIPHLMCPVVTEMHRAAAILEWAVTKMEERYELLAEAGVRDIDSYNGLSWDDLKDRFDPANEEEEAKIPRKVPRMVFVIDELADLMMTNKEVEGFIVRIAQKARAVGIHLILATQRPSANVVTGLIKSNMPCRVSFKVSSGMDSRIVLDTKGAELLLGQGDMLYLSPRTSELLRAQGTLVDDSEVRTVVRYLKKKADQCFEPQLIQLKASASADGDGEDVERDPLFDDAVRIVLETRRGSVSLLQRRLSIGYSRSSRLIEQIADAGIIGEYKGSQAREVNFTLEEWDALKAQAEADAGGGGAVATGEPEADQEAATAVEEGFEEEADDAEVEVDQELEDEDVEDVEDVEVEAEAEEEIEYEEEEEEVVAEADDEEEYEEEEYEEEEEEDAEAEAEYEDGEEEEEESEEYEYEYVEEEDRA